MANTAQAKKRAHQAEKRRQRNASQRSTMRTALKKVIKTIAEGGVEKARNEYQKMASTVDKMVSKGLIHKNKAARHKSRLDAQIKALAG